MRFCHPAILLLTLCFPSFLTAQEEMQEGIRLGNFIMRPEANTLISYDNRASFNRDENIAEGDIYGEIAAGASLYNLPAAYALSVNADYGYRVYDEFDDFNDDFYGAGASVGTGESEGALEWELFAEVAKELSYNTYYDPSTGQGPGPILSDEPNRRWTAGGNVQYAVPLTKNSFVVPGYSLGHYYQEFEESGSVEWQTHTANLAFEHVLSENTTLLAGGFYTLQSNDDEDGYIIILGAGARGRISDKTSWQVLGGMAHVDYELSGADEGGVLDLRVEWQAAERISTYLFYANTYEPGYGGGGARIVYRAGYGIDWRFSPRWSVGGQVLHDNTEEVGGGADTLTYEGTRHFFSAQLAYDPTQRVSVFLRTEYINDEYPIDQKVVSLGIRYVY